ncbi:GNAT family N-acetyltransferase ['Paenibacillus yunnanensis' Narsing Rao et al. 2020]|uniref:GNAT family N-acetyltransferase n=1 Tax=Paenibacillus tengchongensis TaxID=2608684 RepID=UPI00124C7255|nr:GNAT family N-acetyltransferase [Paenibacillus tengchongensis]
MLFQNIDQDTRDAALCLSGTLIVSRGRKHLLTALPGYCAVLHSSVQAAIYYNIEGAECEVVSLDSRAENLGLGSSLIRLVLEEAARCHCSRVWLITSNDNSRAIRFYQKRGFDMVAVHRNAITEARVLKPSIPLLGYDGIPVKHEVEFEYRLQGQ